MKFFFIRIKSYLNLVLPFVLLFQWTLPIIEKKRHFQTNFGELIYDKCKDPEHSHPPLSQRETSEDPEKFVNSDLNNSIFFNEPHKFFNNSGENNFNKSTPSPELSLLQLPPARGPPFFEV